VIPGSVLRFSKNLPPLKVLPVDLSVPAWPFGIMTLKNRPISALYRLRARGGEAFGQIGTIGPLGSRCRVCVKNGKPQSEHMFSGVPPNVLENYFEPRKAQH
jgi:hypothetical protein